LAEGVKALACRYCRAHGTLNNHGRMMDKSGALRARRFWCSPRRRGRPGCGRTFCVWLGSVLPRHSVGAGKLAEFLAAWQRLGGNVLAAWQRARTGFSTDSAYRWAKNFARNQGGVRAWLCRARAPPRPAGEAVHADLFAHLALVFGKAAFTEAFQTRFQEPWPTGANPGSDRKKSPEDARPGAATQDANRLR
jgi:hypothetical protein